MTSNKRVKFGPIMHHLYITYIHSERQSSGPQDYVSSEKSTSGEVFLKLMQHTHSLKISAKSAHE